MCQQGTAHVQARLHVLMQLYASDSSTSHPIGHLNLVGDINTARPQLGCLS